MEASEHDTKVIPLESKRAKKVPARETTYIVLTKRTSGPDWSLMADGDGVPMQFTGTREKVVREAFTELGGGPAIRAAAQARDRAPEDMRASHPLEREISPVALRGWKPATRSRHER